MSSDAGDDAKHHELMNVIRDSTTRIKKKDDELQKKDKLLEDLRKQVSAINLKQKEKGRSRKKTKAKERQKHKHPDPICDQIQSPEFEILSEQELAKLKYEYRSCNDEKTLRLVNCLIGYHQELVKTRVELCNFKQTSRAKLRQVSQTVEKLQDELKTANQRMRDNQVELQDRHEIIQHG